MDFTVSRIPLGDFIEGSIDFLDTHFSFMTKIMSKWIEAFIDIFVTGLNFLHPVAFILLITIISYYLTRKKSVSAIAFFGFCLIWNMGLWRPTMDTLALVVIATLIAMLLGLPLGVCAALSQSVYRVVMPVLDLMQTMPAFVYLIPAIPFFGLGKVAAIFSTVVFSVPPVIRLSCLGIRQVPTELVEAADAFGSSAFQKLFKLQLPMAMPTIMAGINQTVMLALSMVVIAAMIGAKGLGGEVWKAIQRLQSGKGFEAGIGIVIIAILLDRILQQMGKQDYMKSKDQ